MKILLKVVVTAAALWVAAYFVDGIEVTATSTGEKVLTYLAVAAIFGVINAILKPVVKTIGCAFYVLTLGLVALLVNAGLLLLTGWVAGELSLPFEVEWFWPAFWGALIVAVVSWALSLVVDRER